MLCQMFFLFWCCVIVASLVFWVLFYLFTITSPLVILIRKNFIDIISCDSLIEKPVYFFKVLLVLWNLLSSNSNSLDIPFCLNVVAHSSSNCYSISVTSKLYCCAFVALAVQCAVQYSIFDTSEVFWWPDQSSFTAVPVFLLCCIITIYNVFVSSLV